MVNQPEVNTLDWFAFVSKAMPVSLNGRHRQQRCPLELRHVISLLLCYFSQKQLYHSISILPLGNPGQVA